MLPAASAVGGGVVVGLAVRVPYDVDTDVSVAVDVSVGVVVVKYVNLKKDMKLQFRKKCQRLK